MAFKRFRIPGYDVKLDEAEVAVTHTPQFQRLFYLKQLGLAHLIYPAATHTRAAHSIETLYHATKILDSLEENGFLVERQDRLDIRMAALLHDIGHIPFSHTLEDEHKVLKKHDGSERLDSILELLKADLQSQEAKARVESATPLLKLIGDKKGVHTWKSDVVGNTICADLLAYITTDATWTGIEKRSGHYRLYEYFERRPKDILVDGKAQQIDRLCIKITKKGALRTDVVSSILDVLDLRYALTERVLFHHAKCVASSMLARAARLAGLKEVDELLTLGDEGMFNHLEKIAAKAEKADGAGALHLIRCLRSRRLYKRVFKIGSKTKEAWNDGRGPKSFSDHWRDPRNVETLLREVEDANELPRGSLILWCPDAKSGMKAARAHIVWENAGDQHLNGPIELRDDLVRHLLPSVHRRVQMIEDQYNDLWCLWIGLDSRFQENTAAVVQQLEHKLAPCDSVFRETYLAHLPEFRETYQQANHISNIISDLVPSVQGALGDSRALSGKDKELSRATVLSELHKLTKDLAEPRQGDLFSSESTRVQPDDFSERLVEDVEGGMAAGDAEGSGDSPPAVQRKAPQNRKPN